MTGLGVYWDGHQVGLLEREDARSREYSFRYTDTRRPISISLPTSRERFTASESRPFFEALLPEGALREQIAAQLRLPASDSFGLLAELGADCAGALQIVESPADMEQPSVRWLDDEQLASLIEELPRSARRPVRRLARERVLLHAPRIALPTSRSGGRTD
ncbi:MAG TPA: HipA N-terminal domain-containing protein [Solirubrobacteraceae bacterium]|nr:HipA N-terminal domain-containing protein [Solirubrobacteraceae bacterium]